MVQISTLKLCYELIALSWSHDLDVAPLARGECVVAVAQQHFEQVHINLTSWREKGQRCNLNSRR